MLDFTLDSYKSLINRLTNNLFSDTSSANNIIFRHDVDKMPFNSLQISKIEYDFKLIGIYYFRIVPQSNNPKIIEQIASLGHEIGYHYEDLTLCKGNLDEAIRSFEKNLKYFRQFYPVKTICMHGSPLSKYDNRQLWEKYSYKDFGIEFEPYLDMNFTRVFYLTDTGRRWDGESVSVRDKVSVSHAEPTAAKGNRYSVIGGEERAERREERVEEIVGMTKDGRLKVYRDENRILRHNFHSTFDIIRAAEEKILPDHMMITVHPQRWTNNPVLWTKELVMQSIKNQMKRILVKKHL
ncbi:MAG TPA: hypothetical protein VK179_12685 [Bacteroidales bacterium]|nr:hypothetical protein [Bacteroidales bacterium]